MSSKGYLKPLVVVAAFIVAGGLGYWTLYEQPRRDLQERLDAQLRLNESLDRSLADRVKVRQELRELGSATLGASPDEVDAKFRTALQRLAANAGLAGVQVNTTSRDVMNPLGGLGRRLANMPNMPNMRGQRDFSVVRGDLSGTGSLEQVLRAMAMVEAQAWVHRVESFSIKPDGRDQERFALNLSVSTILMPRELAPREVGEPVIAELEAGATQSWAALVEKNPFREPPAPRQVAGNPRLARPAPSPSPPPYNEWRLTGVVESRIGMEAFMVNTRSEERMAIGAGSSVAGAKLVTAEGERAIFEIDGEEYEVFNGQTLEQRRPTNR